MENLPLSIHLLFIATTALCFIIFYLAVNQSKSILVLLGLWLGLQTILGVNGFYTVTDTMPPRFMLMILPPLAAIVILFIAPKGRQYMHQWNTRLLSLLHIVRVPVELVLFLLFLHGQIPQLMTFDGRNFDIIAGITAPFVFYFGYSRKNLSRTVLLVWNFTCLVLLLNIVINGILSAPTPFQQFALDQKEFALVHFPYVWLPSFIVPIVLISHLVSIRQLLTEKSTTVHKQNFESAVSL